MIPSSHLHRYFYTSQCTTPNAFKPVYSRGLWHLAKTESTCLMSLQTSHYITAPSIVLLGGGGGDAGAEGKQSCPAPGGAAPLYPKQTASLLPQCARDVWRTKGYGGARCQRQKWDLVPSCSGVAWGKPMQMLAPCRSWRLLVWTPTSSKSAFPQDHVGGRRWWDWDGPAGRCLESSSPTEHPQPSLWHQSPSNMKR